MNDCCPACGSTDIKDNIYFWPIVLFQQIKFPKMRTQICLDCDICFAYDEHLKENSLIIAEERKQAKKELLLFIENNHLKYIPILD